MAQPAKPITLINPRTEAEYTTTSAVEANDLRFGQGYRLKEEPEPAEETATAPAVAHRPGPRIGTPEGGEQKPDATTSRK